MSTIDWICYFQIDDWLLAFFVIVPYKLQGCSSMCRYYVLQDNWSQGSSFSLLGPGLFEPTHALPLTLLSFPAVFSRIMEEI